MMRRILITHAQSHAYAKRGGGTVKVSRDEAAILSQARAGELIALDDALKSLAVIDVRRSQVVELRFFGGLSNEEIAEVLKISPNTVMRDWKVAKAWLYREMSVTKLGDAHFILQPRAREGSVAHDGETFNTSAVSSTLNPPKKHSSTILL